MSNIFISLPDLQHLEFKRNGYNVAFFELRLGWTLDHNTYAMLQSIAQGKACVVGPAKSDSANLMTWR